MEKTRRREDEKTKTHENTTRVQRVTSRVEPCSVAVGTDFPRKTTEADQPNRPPRNARDEILFYYVRGTYIISSSFSSSSKEMSGCCFPGSLLAWISDLSLSLSLSPSLSVPHSTREKIPLPYFVSWEVRWFPVCSPPCEWCSLRYYFILYFTLLNIDREKIVLSRIHTELSTIITLPSSPWRLRMPAQAW